MKRRHRQTKLQTIFRMMRRPQGVTRREIWNRTRAYRHFAMDKLVAPHGVRYRKRKVNGVLHYYTKDYA